MSKPYETVSQIMAERDQLRAELAALKAGQGEAVAWQFFHDGKWWNGDDRIKDHRNNTEAAGYPIRDLYTAPPASADARLVELLERIVEHLEYDAIGSPSEAIAGDLAKELRALLAQSQGVKP